MRLIDPISKELIGEDYVGSVSPGSTIELIFSKELGKFNNLTVDSKLPNGFDAKVEDYIESVKLFISVPEDAIHDTYPIDITLTGKEVESANIYFVVGEGLLDASLNNYSSTTFVGEPAEYTFTLINNSHADEEFSLDAYLPWYWLNQKGLGGDPFQDNAQTITVSRKSTEEITLVVYPQTYGEKIFDVKIKLTPNEEKTFSLRTNSNQTFKSKTQNIFYGLPFYSFSVIPSFDLVGLFSLLFN